MKMKFILVLLLTASRAYCQDTSKSINISDLKPHDFSYENSWEYFVLEDTIDVKLLDHKPAPVACGVLATASMSIVVNNNGDSIRIISVCNMGNYEIGAKIKILPADHPGIFLTLPFTLTLNPLTKLFEPSLFDLKILKTTWGYFLEE